MFVSELCLGTMTFGAASENAQWGLIASLDQKGVNDIVARSIAAGVNFFDTADVYSFGDSERLLGQSFRDLGVKRSDVIIATKVHGRMGPGANQAGLSRAHILSGIDASLRRLGTDHVDLYQIHRWDSQTPIEETMEALNDVVRSGKARYIGASSMWAWQFAKAQNTAEQNGWARFVSMQDQYNLLQREEEREMFGLLADQGVGSIPWSPLAKGRLARPWGEQTLRSENDPKGQRYVGEENRPIVDAVARIAEARGVPMAQVALAWVLRNPVVDAPIVGPTKEHHLPDAVAALDVRLSDDEAAALEEHYTVRLPSGF
jgi:aryl-alcohol dehydrogenase-like predicted oxidoreductase